MDELTYAMFGAGFFARRQLAAWGEVKGVRCAAVADRSREKAAELAAKHGVPAVYDDARRLLEEQRLDFVDIVTGVESHAALVALTADHGVAAICQKPLARSLAEADEMAEVCRATGVPLLVHENWRWQRPIREVKRVLAAGTIGVPFRASIDMVSGFPVFQRQPYFKDLEQFILADMGSHLLDVARFLFGEAESLYCRTQRVHADIRGEDVATVVLTCGAERTTVVCRMGFAENALERLEREFFPETLIFVEGTQGSVELAPGHCVRTTTRSGTQVQSFPPHVYAWSEPSLALVDESILACHENLVRSLRGETPAETGVEDNLRTVRLVFGSYESARTGEVWHGDSIAKGKPIP